MQLKLRKLYLYATNTHANHTKTYQTVQQFAQKKEKDISTLKDLLNDKLQLPPIASLLLDVRKTKSTVQKQIQPTLKPFKNPHYSPTKAKITTRRQANPSFTQNMDGMEVMGNSSIDQAVHRKYDKFINEYIEKIKAQKILENEQIDHSELVKQACDQIKRRVRQEEKERSKNQQTIIQGNHTFIINAETDDNDLLQEYKIARNLKKKISSKKKSNSVITITHKPKFNSIHPKIDSPSGLSIILSKKNSKKDIRRMFEQGAYQRAQSNANKYMLQKNLQNLRKKNEIIDKERRKSAAYFARSLYKNSFAYGDREHHHY